MDLVIDSLPYADGDLDLTKAEELIIKELKHHASTDAEIPPPEPIKVIDQERFKMLLEHGVQNAKAQLEYQKWREVDLELTEKYGKDQWLQYLKKLEDELEFAQGLVKGSEAEFAEINRRRMQEQVGLCIANIYTI